MQLKDLKPSFSTLPVQEQTLLIQSIQASRLVPKEAKNPTQKRIQERVRTKTKRQKELEELQTLYDKLKLLNEMEKEK